VNGSLDLCSSLAGLLLLGKHSSVYIVEMPAAYNLKSLQSPPPCRMPRREAVVEGSFEDDVVLCIVTVTRPRVKALDAGPRHP